MLKNILILSSDVTGNGHKSITESLLEQFNLRQDLNVKVVDGFSLGGNVLFSIGKLYGTVTRNAKELWRLVWELSFKKPAMLCEITELSIKENFVKLLKSFKPDLILSVHPSFNGSVLNILKEYNLDIQFCTLIADLVSISPLWVDSRADIIFCPTENAKQKCIEFGMPEKNLIVCGFPVRKKFFNAINRSMEKSYSNSRPLECLIMSGGEGSGDMSRIAKILLKNFNCNVNIIAGRNKLLKRRLEKTLGDTYGDRITIHGFISNVHEVMSNSDIAFTRGSPNVALEAIYSNVPLIITGFLPGQEEGNPIFVEQNKLGLVCTDIKELKDLITKLLANNATELNKIIEAQRAFNNPHVARNIVSLILSFNKKQEIDFDAIKEKPIFSAFLNDRVLKMR